MKKIAVVLTFAVAFCFVLGSVTVAFACVKCLGQTVYVPGTYNKISDYEVTVTRIIIRNLDPNTPITLTSVNFYDPNGTLAWEYVDEEAPEVIQPMASFSYVASPMIPGFPDRYPREGGRPYFIVKWEANERVLKPSCSAALLTYSPLNEGSEIWVNRSLGVGKGRIIEIRCR
jgi:hypothetical protein